MNKQYRQGDVFIEQIAEIPKDAKKQKASKNIILAHGQATGHHHELNSDKPVNWWKEGEIPSTKEKPKNLAGEIFIQLPKGGTVTHQEHGPIPLPPGNYRVMRQREYSPEAIRNVMD